MMNQTSPTASTSQSKPLGQQQQQQISIQVANPGPRGRPNLPCSDLIYRGDRSAYLEIVVPLYEASIICDWKAAKAIIKKKPELVRYSITENGETALHLAVTAKGNRQWMNEFVKNLVDMMEKEDLELQNKNYNTAFYLAAMAGKVETIKIMMERNRGLPKIPRANGQMIPLYAAAAYGNYEAVKYLYENSKELREDCWNHKNRTQLLEKCVEADMFDVALTMVKKYPELVSGSVLLTLARKPDLFPETETPIFKRIMNKVFALTCLAVGADEIKNEALQLLKVIWKEITKRPKKEIDYLLRGPPESENLVRALPLQKVIFEHLGKLDVETENIMGGPHYVGVDKALKLQQLISEHLVNIDAEIKKQNANGDPSSELQKLISNHVVIIHYELKNIINDQVFGGEEDQESYLRRLIFKHISKMNALSGLYRKQYAFRILFVAAEMGNTKFLVELIHQYPDLIWKVNDDYQTIFHIAVKYRHEAIYNLLYEIGSRKAFIASLKDVDDNNMLHLAGKGTVTTRLERVSGAPLQMQRELLWFMEVGQMIPPSFHQQRNKDGLTPKELFLEDHKELIKEGEKWMKETASQCMVVATLITTIGFAGAITIPGGFNQDDGIPIFYRKPIFVVFVVADAMSLLLSSSSILILLTIFISRYAEFDFVESLPKKLMFGMSSLLLSIIANDTHF